MQNKKNLLTSEGWKKAQDELEFLKTKRRREVADAIQRAKEQGDLSENAEYVEAKEQQGLLETRIAELEAMIKNADVVEKTAGDIVAIGDSVKLRLNGKELDYKLVGPNEADPLKGLISHESPIGTAILGKRPGDKVDAKTPAGTQKVEILAVA